MDNSVLQLGAVAILFLIFIKDFFNWLKGRKNGNNHTPYGETHFIKMYEELKLMNENHLHSIENAINDGNREIVKAINDGNLRIIESLGEIKGNLRK